MLSPPGMDISSLPFVPHVLSFFSLSRLAQRLVFLLPLPLTKYGKMGFLSSFRVGGDEGMTDVKSRGRNSCGKMGFWVVF